MLGQNAAAQTDGDLEAGGRVAGPHAPGQRPDGVGPDSLIDDAVNPFIRDDLDLMV